MQEVFFFFWCKHARSTIFVSERSVHATVAAVLELVYCKLFFFMFFDTRERFGNSGTIVHGFWFSSMGTNLEGFGSRLSRNHRTPWDFDDPVVSGIPT